MKKQNYERETALVWQMDKARRKIANRFQGIINQHGLEITVEQWMVLTILWESNGLVQQHLADTIHKDKTTITRLIDGLEKRNLIVRVPDKTDRRQKMIYLTEKGKKLEDKLLPLNLENLHYALRDIEPEHLKLCEDVLRKINNNLDQ